MQSPKSFLAWQLLANFSATAESPSTFPLFLPVSFWCLSLLLSPPSWACGDCDLASDTASVGMGSLAPIPVVVLSVCSEPGNPSFLVLGSASLIGSVGHSELGHLCASSADLNGTFLKCAIVLVTELPLGLLATILVPFLDCTSNGSASYGSVALLTASLRTHRVPYLYVRGFDISSA